MVAQKKFSTMGAVHEVPRGVTITSEMASCITNDESHIASLPLNNGCYLAC